MATDKGRVAFKLHATTQCLRAMHSLMGSPWPVLLTTNWIDRLKAAIIFPFLMYKCENLLEVSIKRITSILIEMVPLRPNLLSPGIRMERLRVLSSIGGLGPSF